MRREWCAVRGLVIVLMVVVVAGPAIAQEATGDSRVRFKQRNMSGPRFGVTVVTGNGEMWEDLDDKGMGRVVSQFGWHFERQIVPQGGGPQFVLQCVPMVAGVEYGKAIPSLTFAMGVRFPSGVEFGIGPNVSAVDVNNTDPVRSALVVALGKSFDYGGVSLPVNVAFATSPEGQRVSLIVGYAIQRSAPAARTEGAP